MEDIMNLIREAVQFVNITENKHFGYTRLYPDYSIINKNDLMSDILNNAQSSGFIHVIESGYIKIYSAQYPDTNQEPCISIAYMN